MTERDLIEFNAKSDYRWHEQNQGKITKAEQEKRNLSFKGWLEQPGETFAPKLTAQQTQRPSIHHFPKPKPEVTRIAPKPVEKQLANPPSSAVVEAEKDPNCLSCTSPKKSSFHASPAKKHPIKMESSPISASRAPSEGRQDNRELTYLLVTFEINKNGVPYYLTIEETVKPQRYYLTVNNVQSKSDKKSIFFVSRTNPSELKEYVKDNIEIITDGNGAIRDIELTNVSPRPENASRVDSIRGARFVQKKKAAEVEQELMEEEKDSLEEAQRSDDLDRESDDHVSKTSMMFENDGDHIFNYHNKKIEPVTN